MSSDHTPLPLELALIRWSVVCESWGELSAGSAPVLTAFLAGWGCRCIGTSKPTYLGTFPQSFLAGWREAARQEAQSGQLHLAL